LIFVGDAALIFVGAADLIFVGIWDIMFINEISEISLEFSMVFAVSRPLYFYILIF
jgi:hypothetical protein